MDITNGTKLYEIARRITYFLQDWQYKLIFFQIKKNSEEELLF